MYELSGVTEMDLHSGIESLPVSLPVCYRMPDLRKFNFDIPNLKREPVPTSDYIYPLIDGYGCSLDSLVIGRNVETIAESLLTMSR